MPLVNVDLPDEGEDANASDVSIPFLALLAIFNGHIGTDNIEDGAITPSKLSGDVSSIGVPTGVFMPYGGSVAPAGWLFCDGASYARSTYAKLYAAIGTNFGNDSETTFKVPNLKSSFPAGYNSADTNFNTIGKVGGEAAHALTGAENGVHAHGVNDPGHAHGVNDPGHSHLSTNTGQNVFTGASTNTTTDNRGGGFQQITWGNTQTGVSGSNIGIFGSGTGVSIQNSGSGTPHNNLPPYLTTNYIIKT